MQKITVRVTALTNDNMTNELNCDSVKVDYHRMTIIADRPSNVLIHLGRTMQ